RGVVPADHRRTAGHRAGGSQPIDEDVGEVGGAATGGAGVVGVEHERLAHLGDAVVQVADLVHRPAGRGVALDTQPDRAAADDAVGVDAGDRVVLHEHVGDPGGGLAADGDAVRAVEVVVLDGDVLRRHGSGLDRDAVVAVHDVAVGDRDVGCAARVDPVGVVRVRRGLDLHAPRGEAGGVLVDHVEVRGVEQVDVVEHEVVCLVRLDQPRVVLAQALRVGLGGQGEPAGTRAVHGKVAATVDAALRSTRRAHPFNAGVGAVDRDERLAPAAARGRGPAFAR